jgi:hypothetical protein
MKDMMVQKVERVWKPKPVKSPQIDPEFLNLSGFQRATESFRYCLLRWEHWASPQGDMREWLRHNSHVAAWLIIPAILVMPATGLILWHLTGWLSMLTTIAGKLLVLPILFLLAFFVIRMVAAFIGKR